MKLTLMDDIRLAMLGSKEAAKRLTDAGVLVPCHRCGGKAEVLCKKLGLDYYIKDSLRKEMEAQP